MRRGAQGLRITVLFDVGSDGSSINGLEHDFQGGGIDQVLSGSPITQNGHILGAVTHVFISDSKMGYGIFIENMLEH